MSLEENLLYPLFLLGVGTGITYVLGHTLTKRYQNRQKELDRLREDRKHELEIKQFLIQRIAENMVKAIIMIVGYKQSYKGQKVKPTLDEFKDHYRNALIDRCLIELYYPESEILKIWEKNFDTNLTLINFIAEADEPNFKLDERLQELKNKLHFLFDHLTYDELKGKFEEEGFRSLGNYLNRTFTEFLKKLEWTTPETHMPSQKEQKSKL